MKVVAVSGKMVERGDELLTIEAMKMLNVDSCASRRHDPARRSTVARADHESLRAIRWNTRSVSWSPNCSGATRAYDRHGVMFAVASLLIVPGRQAGVRAGAAAADRLRLPAGNMPDSPLDRLDGLLHVLYQAG